MTDYNTDKPQGEGMYEDAVHDAEFVQPDEQPRHEDVDKSESHRPNPDQLGENFKKLANEAAYAAVGFAGLVGEKAKEFYEDQKRQYAETHPDADHDPGAKDFLAQLREKIDKFVDELTKGYKDMADRGRAKADRPADGSAPSGDPVDVPSQHAEADASVDPEATNYPE
ncbi:hypothetical protein [Tessaracoccus flavus]|uniref:Uncharacterized protein n=1 Tax=Tessaracoccus flavus TaxID=1610493 RepID=A0A1Q2CH27_9ACTN|nr:hypothetical protein [Tessaracoccus flavus]AQP45414.1 hypothetical protein RPIT_11900 [Tessaracoccus flavus]SDY92779.1 hypothetical protein SAMN05428934_10695 [Tessaracoccus flavus]